MTKDDIIKALDWHAPTVEMGSQSLLRRIESLVAQAEAAERERIKAANAPVIENINKHLDEMRRPAAENERIGPLAERVLELKAQRDALLGALQSTGLFLHHCWCDVQMNDYSFEKLSQQMAIVDAAIKAVEEQK